MKFTYNTPCVYQSGLHCLAGFDAWYQYNSLIMQYGKIKWFDAEKGFGFIKPDEGGKDIFVHKNNIENLGYNEGLEDDEEVEFDVEETPKGLSAIEVRRV